MKQPQRNRWRILAEFLLILLPIGTLLAADPLGIDRTQALWITGSCVLSCAVNIAVLWASGRWLDQADRSLSRQVYLLIPTLQYAFLVLMLMSSRSVQVNTGAIMNILLGLMFVVMGNILPKSEPNPVFGVRTHWTMASRENWIRTSRLTGWIWVAGGLLCWACVLFEVPFGLDLAVVLVVALAPVPVSYWIYRKQVKAGTWQEEPLPGTRPASRGTKLVTGLVTIGGLVLVAILLVFGGRYTLQIRGGQLEAKAPLAGDRSFPLAQAQSIRLQEAGDPGTRNFGYSAFGIDLGSYYNTKYGSYDRYTGKSPVVIELQGEGEPLVVSLQEAAATEALYTQLCENVQPGVCQPEG